MYMYIYVFVFVRQEQHVIPHFSSIIEQSHVLLSQKKITITRIIMAFYGQLFSLTPVHYDLKLINSMVLSVSIEEKPYKVCLAASLITHQVQSNQGCLTFLLTADMQKLFTPPPPPEIPVLL